ncbi:unnamed protein product [Nyctereutes procyonoides]|uniref:(raccoon dog) hypothetical protein n=1 Tax=Nyctereutes procyonoides TaxID=34880 RepID=A0A811YTF5_NYCPR|nr:unnamed protein product [Nyctereutes procyonoides]
MRPLAFALAHSLPSYAGGKEKDGGCPWLKSTPAQPLCLVSLANHPSFHREGPWKWPEGNSCDLTGTLHEFPGSHFKNHRSSTSCHFLVFSLGSPDTPLLPERYELRLPLPKPIFRGLEVLKIFQTILDLIVPPAGERGGEAITNQVMVALHLDPQASPNILTFLLASKEMSSTLNPTTLCREADVPCFTIPSDPVPEMDKLKISLTAKLHSTFPPLRREAWEWLQGCKQLNLEAPRGNRKQPGQSAHQHPPPGTRWTYLFQVLTCTSLLLLPSHPHFLHLCAGAAVHRL